MVTLWIVLLDQKLIIKQMENKNQANNEMLDSYGSEKNSLFMGNSIILVSSYK